MIINQTRFTKPGGHQDYRTFAVFRQLEQSIRIADLNIVRTEAFFVQRLLSKRDYLILIALAGLAALRSRATGRPRAAAEVATS